MIVKIVIICVTAVVIQHLAKLLYLMDFHKTVYNHVPGYCNIVPGIDHGSEDMETLPNGLTFITSGWTLPSLLSENAAKYRKENGVTGKIYLFDFNTPKSGVKELEIIGDFNQSDFFPHGISVWYDNQSGKCTLFVVSHGHTSDSIESFEYLGVEKKLKHLRSYKSNKMTICNDVVAVSEDRFYYTNTVYYKSTIGFMTEFLLMLSWGSIGYFDGTEYKIANDRMQSPNGLALSRDKRYLYILTGVPSMKIYNIESGGALRQVNEILLNTYPDNPTVTINTESILIGAHPVAYKLMQHSDKPDLPSPSQVLLMRVENGSNVTFVTELYSDEGHTLYGSSVASLFGNQLLIGTVQHKLMYCRVTVPT